MFVSFKAAFHLKDFRERENNTMCTIYFNQETLTVSVFRIYHIETHVTNQQINKSLTEFQYQNLLFTFLTNDYEEKLSQTAFSELVRISHGNIYLQSFLQYLLIYFMHGISICLVRHVMRYLALFKQISLRRSYFRSE